MVDVLVIGGGIHGVAVARDAALRGLSVLLLERGDLASATSSRTSKLIHGGLRYLETGQVRLVREALRERAILLEIAPDFIRPLPFLVPHYASRGRRRAIVRLGLALYSWLGGMLADGGRSRAARSIAREQALDLAPGLDEEGLRGASLFADAQVDDAGFCIALALDAERAGAAVRTHTELTALARTVDGRSWRAHFRDRIEGVDAEVEASLVVNAAGPWSDTVREMAFGNSPALLRRTRGAHIVYPILASEHGLLLTARSDGRVFFVLPWGAHALVGTTDVDDERDPAGVLPEAPDVRYLIEEASSALPGAFQGVRPVRAFAGTRSLLRARADRPSENTREHRVHVRHGMWSIVGGKYTTHRRLAERVVDQIVRALRRRAAPCVTASLPVRSRRAEGVERLRTDFPRSVDLPGGAAISEAEVVHAARAEKARRLEDVLLRRTRFWLDSGILRAAAVPCAVWLAPVLGWSERTRTTEVERFLGMLDREERIVDEALAAAPRDDAADDRARA